MADAEGSKLLHGNIKFHIIEAKNLPDTDSTFFNVARGDLTDPFIEVKIGGSYLLRTAYIENNLNPVWNELFNVPVCHEATEIQFQVRDREHVGSTKVGSFAIQIADVVGGDEVEGWYDIIVGNHGETQGSVHILLQFIPMPEDGDKMLHDVYFTPKRGNRVTLYQDAMTPQLSVFDGIVNSDGSHYVTTNCWRDLYHAINNARRVIYITGWSLFTGIGLLRGEEAMCHENSNVGELLKKKAEQGVTVLMMIWNDEAGLLGTHDQETARFFKDTRVKCVNLQRVRDSWLGLGSTFVKTCYSHHQKSVIVDADMDGSDTRRLIAFVGGIDITDGRYDTPEYPLFKTINTVHAGDFYSKCVPQVTPEVGPREPWHDIHARIEGPAAFDICENFIDRWSKQAADYEGYLVEMSEGFDLKCEAPKEKGQGGDWVVQVLRSITSDSTFFDEGRINVLHRKSGRLVDNSIMKSYVNLIRNASNFLYIENQYFLGSAFSWFRDRSTSTNHIIPKEIAQKIVNKIKAGEKFKVYVTIPMYPEGDPHSMASQEILHWQTNTIVSMYKAIAKAIEDAGIDAHPQDYLNIFCLGKREGIDDIPDNFLRPNKKNSFHYETIKNIRHPIYVHSKLMIVDDEVIVVGSANINQRSLGGNRDSEICIGAFQPDHTIKKSGNIPSGAVQTFRMALWAAHLGGWDPAYEDPVRDECLAKMKQVSNDFWKLYTDPYPTFSHVHLLPYPLTVAETGDISPLESPWDCFPDTSAKVIGKKCPLLPPKITT